MNKKASEQLKNIEWMVEDGGLQFYAVSVAGTIKPISAEQVQAFALIQLAQTRLITTPHPQQQQSRQPANPVEQSIIQHIRRGGGRNNG